jgi:hypothetical protein
MVGFVCESIELSPNAKEHGTRDAARVRFRSVCVMGEGGLVARGSSLLLDF